MACNNSTKRSTELFLTPTSARCCRLPLALLLLGDFSQGLGPPERRQPPPVCVRLRLSFRVYAYATWMSDLIRKRFCRSQRVHEKHKQKEQSLHLTNDPKHCHAR